MNRKDHLNRLSSSEFDVLVIGGGITGAGVALDAQTRGLSTALVEMGDFASGTSSRSTKLIHGGLRYLKQLEFRLVTEVGRERSVLHKLAPHLVHPDKMLLPIVKDGNYGKLITYVGLTIYDLLAGVKSDDRFQMFNRKEAMAAEPLLRTDILEGGGLYAEYRTDDARLVISILKTADDHGATLANYCRVEELLYDNGTVCGARVRDTQSDEVFDIRARAVVNAAGPWSDELRKMDRSSNPANLFLSKGVHVVIHKDRLPIKHTVYFDNEDGRMVFAIPRDQVVYLGTTDTEFQGEIADPKITHEDANYLLEAANYMFPSAKLEEADLLSGWAGIRPLIRSKDKASTEISRKDELFLEDSGLITIAGGKLTGYRKMAQRTVDKVVDEHQIKASDCRTHEVKVHGNDFAVYGDVQSLEHELRELFSDQEIDTSLGSALVHQFGGDARKVAERFLELGSGFENFMRAEIEYCTKHEMVQTALDYVGRRTGWLLYRPWQLAPQLDLIIGVLGEQLAWDEARREQEMQAVVGKLMFMREEEE
jgi:glycerol-3-phosphate dehydrogenase